MMELVAIAETRIIARNDQAAGTVDTVFGVTIARRKAHIAYEEFGREPPEKNEKNDRFHDEEKQLRKHAGHS